MLDKLILLFFPLLMAYAASSDLLTMRISNRIVMALVGGFIVLALVINLPLQIFAMHAAAALLVLVVAFAFFSFGWIGGGDAKLAAATTLWFGFAMSLPYLLTAAIWGGVMTFVFIIARNFALPPMLQNITWIERLHNKTSGVPYGIALAAAGLMTYPKSVVFLHFLA